MQGIKNRLLASHPLNGFHEASLGNGLLWPNTCVFPLVIASFFIAEQIVLTGVFNPADIFAFTAFFGELKTRAFAMTIFFCTAIVVAFGFQTLLNVLGFEVLSIP